MILPTFLNTDEGLVATFPNDSIEDRLVMRSAQLDSLMSLMVADDHFSRMGSQIQSDIIWLVSTLSEEVRQLIDAQFSEKLGLSEETQRVNEGCAVKEATTGHDLTIAAHSVLARSREHQHA